MFAILGSLLLSAPPGSRNNECLGNLLDKGDEVITIYSSGRFDPPAPIRSSWVRLGIEFDIPFKNNFQYTTDTYIVDFNDLHELERVVGKLSDRQVLNVKQRNLFTTDNAIPIERIIETLWRYGFSKFILILQDEIYTWTPNLGGCGNFSAATRIDHCNVTFPKGTCTCPVRARVSIWPPFVNPPESTGAGLDINLMNTIAEGLKFKVIYTVSDSWSDDFEGANDSNNFRALQHRTADVLISSVIPTFKRNQFFELSRYYHAATDGFCVPTGGKLPQYRKWLEVANIYGYSLLALLIFSIVNYILNLKIAYTKHLLDFFSILTSQAIEKLPETHTLRIILITWLIFTLHVNIFYQTKLISVMDKPTYTKQITTIDDLLDSKLHLLFLEHYKRYFEYDDGARAILKRIEDCRDIRICLKNVTVDRNSAVCVQYSSITFYLDKIKDEDGRPLIYCFRDAVNTSPLVMVMNRNFYLLDEINRYIGYCTESGFVQKWVEDFFANERYFENEIETQPLQLGNLRVVFCIYSIGMVAAFVVFVLERIRR